MSQLRKFSSLIYFMLDKHKITLLVILRFENLFEAKILPPKDSVVSISNQEEDQELVYSSGCILEFLHKKTKLIITHYGRYHILLL